MFLPLYDWQLGFHNKAMTTNNREIRFAIAATDSIIAVSSNANDEEMQMRGHDFKYTNVKQLQ